MKIIAFVGKERFIVKEKEKHYLISTSKKTIVEIENPDDLYRSGYWSKYTGGIDHEREEIIISLLEKNKNK